MIGDIREEPHRRCQWRRQLVLPRPQRMQWDVDGRWRARYRRLEGFADVEQERTPPPLRSDG